MRHENQELSTEMRAEAKEVVREEMETIHTEMKEHLEKSDQVFRQHQVVVSQEIKTLNKKVTNSNKKNDEQIQKLTELYENNCTTMDGQLPLMKEDMRARLAQIERAPMQRGITMEHVKNVTFNGEGTIEGTIQWRRVHKPYEVCEGIRRNS